MKTAKQIESEQTDMDAEVEKALAKIREKQARKSGNLTNQKSNSSSAVVSKGCARGNPGRSTVKVADAGLNKTGRE